MNVKPVFDKLLVEPLNLDAESVTDGGIVTIAHSKERSFIEANILAVSESCASEGFKVGQKIYINKYDLIKTVDIQDKVWYFISMYSVNMVNA